MGSPDIVITPQNQQNFSFALSTKSLEPTINSNILEPEATKSSIPVQQTKWPQLRLKEFDSLPPTNTSSPNSSDTHKMMVFSFQNTTIPMQLTTTTQRTEILNNFDDDDDDNNNNNNITIGNLNNSIPISCRHLQLQNQSECQILHDDCHSHHRVNSCNDHCQCNGHSSFSLSVSSSRLVCCSEVKKKMSVANLLSSNDCNDEHYTLPSLQSDIQLSFPEWFQEEKKKLFVSHKNTHQ
jgi:hypothetical protein